MGRSPSNPSEQNQSDQDQSERDSFKRQNWPGQNASPRRSPRPRSIDPELYARLQAEAKAPYRALRRFIYVACAASGFIGGFIFLSQVLAGQTTPDTLENLGVQIGVVALMVFLLRIDRAKS